MPEDGDSLVPALLRSIVCAMVDRPKEVRVEARTAEDVTTLAIHVHPEDIRRVEDRQGNNLLALRTVIRGAGIKRKREYKVVIAREEAKPV